MSEIQDDGPIFRDRPEFPEGSNTTRKAVNRFKELLTDPVLFAKGAIKTELRSYQCAVAYAIFNSVVNQRGFNFVVIFPRQTGKNELQAHLEVFILTLLSRREVEVIKVAPTLIPQARISQWRFERVLRNSFMTEGLWRKENNNYIVGGARISFLSAAPTSNIVGATASGMLEVDEAQDVTIIKFDRDVSPMSASTNATRVFWGTTWTSKTLLAREMRAAMEEEKRDGVRRVFRLTAEDVYAEVPSYRNHVEEMVARQGRTHPSIRTQYFSEEIDGAGGMFPTERVARMRSGLRADNLPPPKLTALLLDVAGEDEGVRSLTGEITMANPARDATALTLVEIVLDQEGEKEGAADPDTGRPTADGMKPPLRVVGHGEHAGYGKDITASAIHGDEGMGRPTLRLAARLPIYRVRRRWQWIGVSHTRLQAEIRAIAMEWQARALVVDATGVGAGLTSFLERALPGRVIPFVFSRVSKSKLGWDFLGVVDSFRWQEPVFDDLPGDDQLKYQNEFFKQLAACQFEVKADHAHSMAWQVPEGSRDPESGDLLHDDWVLSAALCALLDQQDWHLPTTPMLIQGVDPLDEMDGRF